MMKKIKYIAFLLAGIGLALAGSVSAGMISVPSSSGFGQILVGLTTGNYQASSSPTIAGTVTARNFVATSTASSTFPVFYSATGTVSNLLTFIASSSGIYFYNTTDTGTNYQVGKLGWANDILTLSQESGGSAQQSIINIGTSTKPHISIQPNNPQFRYDAPSGNNDTSNPFVRFISTGGLTAASGVQNFFDINPIIAQSGTAKYSAFVIDPTEISLGSGHSYLIYAGTSSAQQLFSVDNTGDIYTPIFAVQEANGNNSILTLSAPAGNPQESTLTTMRNLTIGSTADQEWTDWTDEDYGIDRQTSINIAKRGTGILRPFIIRFWNADLGNVNAVGTTNFVSMPNGASGFGAGSTTMGLYPNIGLLVASSAPTYFVSKVGIGTSSPYAKLSVVGETVSSYFTATTTSINTFPQIAFTNGTGTSIFITSSSTIGGGTRATGGTIFGGATTTNYTALASGLDNAVAPTINIGTGGSQGNSIGFSGGRAMFGYDDGLGMSAINSGTSKGIVFYVSGTNGVFKSGTNALNIQPAGNVGIGTTSPYAKLSVTGKSGATTPLFAVASSTNALSFAVLSNGLQVTGGSVPTVATSTGSGTGSVPVTVLGAPNIFNLNITTGTTPAGTNAVIATVTLPSTCPSATVPVFSPANANASALAVVSVPYASSTGASTFNLVSGATGLAGATNYKWNFSVGCY